MSMRTASVLDQDYRKPRPGPWTRRPYTSCATNATPACNGVSNKAASAVAGAAILYAAPVSITADDHADPPSKAAQPLLDHPGEARLAEDNVTSTSEDKMGTSSHKGRAVVSAIHSSGSSTFKTPNLPHANTFPCTPGARLPLEDLIGNCDEPPSGELTHSTPEEHIGWNPNSSSASLTPNRRKRKRAKSSSPSCPNSSSQAELNLALLGDGMKNPATDPTTDLWQRYASGNQIGSTLKLPTIGAALLQGSPRPLETPVKSGPFRRWASTGSVLTENKSKRRCTNARSSIQVWQDETSHTSTSKSKVAAMVQKIQQSLASQQLEQENDAKLHIQQGVTDIPSSSSPLPETGIKQFTNSIVVSPLQARQPSLQSPAKGRVNPRAPGLKSAPAKSTLHADLPSSIGGSKYAEDLLIPSAAGPLHLQSKAPLPAYKRPSITRPPTQQKLLQVPPLPPLPPARTDVEEYGEDAFDLTADDLDELLSQKPLEERSLYGIPQYRDSPHVVLSVEALQHATITIDDDGNVDNDEFACDDIDEELFAQAELSATEVHRASPRKRNPHKSRNPRKPHATSLQSTTTSATSENNSRFQRYTIKQVVEGEYTDNRGERQQEKVLLVQNESTDATTAITLRGSWSATSVSTKDVVHIAQFPRHCESASACNNPPGQVMVNDEAWSPLLIVHPDHMLSATTVADSFDCVRKAVLQDRVKATGETSKAMVYGKILHEIFQQSLSANKWDDDFLRTVVDRTVQAHIEGLWELGMRDTNLAIEEIKAKMAELAAWATLFIAETPTDNCLVDERQGATTRMSISKLIAIEEHVWSPQFGLKGNVDATVQTTLLDHDTNTPRNLIVPFEVKTGRTTQSPAHRAQTALYTLLLSDRYDVAVEAGILYYLESSSMTRIAPPLTEVRQMVQQRNRLASHIYHARHPLLAKEVEGVSTAQTRPMGSEQVHESGLPNLLKDAFKCGRCYAQASCFTYHALVENGTAASAGMVDDPRKNHSLVWKEAVGHLLAPPEPQSGTEALNRWFTRWDKLLTFEEGEVSRLRKELWTMSSEQREQLGRCFGKLALTKDMTSVSASFNARLADDIEGGGGKINRYTYAFTRAAAVTARPFTEGSQLTVGEPIVVSSESGQWSLANGYIVSVARHQITVAVDRRLGRSRDRLIGFDSQHNQAFRGVMTVGSAGEECVTPEKQPLLYRLDKDEFSNGLALIRNNLVSLMSSHPIHTKLRQQIIDSTIPTFTSTPLRPSQQPQPAQLGGMNQDQEAAVDKVLSAQDYALILGMPGTGKTTTIAHIIQALLADGQSILLTSFTHTAVDNILLKIRSITPVGSILRLGVPAKINNEVQEFCRLAASPCKTIEEIEDAYMKTQIVAATCMGTNHAVFQRRTFDVCIVDEASQITLPTILGPLLRARRFVLVGDHFQLPPLVQNKAALQGGLDISLFRQLSEEHPESVATLGKQYRMCQDIMTLSNELIYDGKLKCGNESVANRTIRLDENAALTLDQYHRSTRVMQQGCSADSICWLSRIVHPLRKVVFANTDQIGIAAKETLTGGKNITNQLEATLAAQLVISLLSLGIAAREIGVITLYRSQLSLLRQLFPKAGITPEVDIDSADRFQGRDKECIIISMVRNNEAGVVGDLLKDWRRVNVALTRARSKLIVLGSRSTLQNNPLLAKFLALVDRERWSTDLPSHADQLHTFNFSTQVTQALLDEEESSKLEPSHASMPAASMATPSRSPTKRRPLTASSPNVGHNTSSGPKRVQGKQGRLAKTLKSAKEEIAFEIFEDLTGEEF